MYIFNRITVNPQLPKRINRLNEIANNLWWAWNTEFLRLLKTMDGDLWEKCDKNPVKFLKHISQEKLEEADHDKYVYPLFELDWKIDVEIHPIMYTLKDWLKRNFSLFYKNVEQDGIVLC